MDRREFMFAGVAAGTAITLGAQRAFAHGSKSNRPKFRMKYAPHFGMFRNSAGDDPIDQLKFAADQGFTAWEDNGMMRKSIELQKKIAITMEQLDMTMGVFVSSGGFDRTEFTTSTSKELHDRLREQMKKAVEVAKHVNATWSTFVPGNISQKLERDYQMANCIENLKVCADVCEPAGLVLVLEPLNWWVREIGPRLEKEGQHEEAAFYYRAGLDFYTAIMQLWIGTVYDERVDEIYQQYAEAFGEEGWRSADYEERWDTMAAYLFFFNREGVARNVEKGNFSAAQRARLEERIRIYIEDLIDPDNGFGGDFSFSRKAWILERTGLFWHAAFSRELAWRYAIGVCSRYYAAVADEMERVYYDPTRAKLYPQKATQWRSRGMDEFHLCNGDKVLARLKGDDKLRRLSRNEVIAVLKKGLRDQNNDARRAAVRILSDMGDLEALEWAMKDDEVEIRKAAATFFADKMYLPGLALALKDKAGEVASVARAVVQVKTESVGPYLRAIQFLSNGLQDERTKAFSTERLWRLSGLTLGDSEVEWRDWVQQATGGAYPGALVEYFNEPAQTTPVTAKVFETIDIGLRFQANFPKVWYDYWD